MAKIPLLQKLTHLLVSTTASLATADTLLRLAKADQQCRSNSQRRGSLSFSGKIQYCGRHVDYNGKSKFAPGFTI